MNEKRTDPRPAPRGADKLTPSEIAALRADFLAAEAKMDFRDLFEGNGKPQSRPESDGRARP